MLPSLLAQFSSVKNQQPAAHNPQWLLCVHEDCTSACTCTLYSNSDRQLSCAGVGDFNFMVESKVGEEPVGAHGPAEALQEGAAAEGVAEQPGEGLPRSRSGNNREFRCLFLLQPHASLGRHCCFKTSLRQAKAGSDDFEVLHAMAPCSPQALHAVRSPMGKHMCSDVLPSSCCIPAALDKHAWLQGTISWTGGRQRRQAPRPRRQG